MPDFPSCPELRRAAMYALHKLGWSDHDIGAAFRATPSMFKLNEQVVRNAINEERQKEERRQAVSAESAMVLNTPLEELPIEIIPMSVRLTGVIDGDVRTVGDFLRWSNRPTRDLLATKKIGKRTLDEALSLRDSIEANPDMFLRDLRAPYLRLHHLA